MGASLGGCSGTSSVHVISISCRGKNSVVHSDSCDSGISVGESQIRGITLQNGTLRHDVDSEEEEVGVPGHDVSIHRHGMVTPSRSRLTGAGVPTMEEYGSMSYSYDTRKHRRRARGPGSKSLRHPNHTSPTLLDDAIDEEDEELQDGDVDDKRCRPPRPPRPRSAHFRKSRSHTPQSPAGGKAHGGDSGGESSIDLSSDDGEEEEEEEFEPDILSIPDETGSQRLRPDSLAAYMLGQHAHNKQRLHGSGSLPNQPAFSPLSRPDSTDWWIEEDCASLRSRDMLSRDSSCRSRGNSFTFRCHNTGRAWLPAEGGRVSKKSSERSISSILLTTAVELGSSSTPATPVPSSTNPPACFALTNPEITQHILKVSNSQQAASLATCMRNLIRSSGSLQDVSVSKSRQDLGQKLREMFVVRAAPKVDAELKSEPENLSKKLHDLFVVADAKKEVQTPEQDKANPEDDSGEVTDLSSRDSPTQKSLRTILVSPAPEDNVRNLTRPKPLRGLLVTSRSESSVIGEEEGKKVKKKVSFSPDVPNVSKCSKNYRSRTVAMMRRAREMRCRGHGRSALFKPRGVSGYTCRLCRKDCIARMCY